MTGKKASYNPGLVPVKGQKFDPCVVVVVVVLEVNENDE
jgi:hypothetical protein